MFELADWDSPAKKDAEYLRPKKGISEGSIDWLKGKITGKSHIAWENLWFSFEFPLSQPIESFPGRLRFSSRVSRCHRDSQPFVPQTNLLLQQAGSGPS